MTSLLSIAMNIGLGLLLVFLVFRSGILGYIYDARASSEGIQFLLFSRFVVSTVKYDNIEEVVEPPAGGIWNFTAYNYKNRAGVPCFLIRKKRAWFARSVLITPRDAEAFVTMLKNAGVVVSGRSSGLANS